MRSAMTGQVLALAAAGLVAAQPDAFEVDDGIGAWWSLPVPRRRGWAKMDEPHNYPPSPFESRQVRRARERWERKQSRNSETSR